MHFGFFSLLFSPNVHKHITNKNLDSIPSFREQPVNLICPSCQKIVAADETKAGKTMKCPLCGADFAVPGVPGPASPLPLDIPDDLSLEADTSARPPSTAPDAVHEPPVYQVAPEPPKPPPPRAAPQPKVEAPAPAPAPRREERPRVEPPPAPLTSLATNERVIDLHIRQEWIPWIAPAVLALAFLLMFFPWTGAYPAGYGLYTQTGFQAISASYSIDPVGEKVLHLQSRIDENISADWFSLTLYLLLLLWCLTLSVWPLLESHANLRLPPALEMIRPWRQALLGVSLLVAFLFLSLRLWGGLGLEDALAAPIDAGLDKQRAAAQTQEEKTTLEINRGTALGALQIRRTWWLCWEYFFLLVGLAVVSLDLWAKERGGRVLPHVQLRL
jgi:hypothetical protein